MSDSTPILLSKTYTYKHQPTGEPILATAHYAPSSNSSFPPRRPLAIVFHGGGFMLGHKDVVPKSQISYLAVDHGFVVVSADYRLCPQVTLREGPLVDAIDAYNWARDVLPGLLEAEEGQEKVIIDSGRVGVFGHSAGGLLAMNLAFLPNPPSAILDFYGSKFFHDPWWSQPNTSKPVPYFPSEFTQQVFSEQPVPSVVPILIPGVNPDFKMTPRLAYMLNSYRDGTSLEKLMPDRADYDVIDPATRWNKPGVVVEGKLNGVKRIGFVHGDQDEMLPVEFAERAGRELKELGVEVEVVVVKGAKHGFDAGVEKGESEEWKGVEHALKYFVGGI